MNRSIESLKNELEECQSVVKIADKMLPSMMTESSRIEVQRVKDEALKRILEIESELNNVDK